MNAWTKVIEPILSVDTAVLPGMWQPKGNMITAAFDCFAVPSDVKVIIIGQDPYHTPGYATGIAFATPPDAPKTPPSLVAIKRKYGIVDSSLKCWTEQGVLLINTALTVEIGKPNSHSSHWSQPVKEALLNLLLYMQGQEKAVHFVLWGRHALSLHASLKQRFEDSWPHTCCASSHPSPLSRRRHLGKHPPFESHCAADQCPCRCLYGKEAD